MQCFFKCLFLCFLLFVLVFAKGAAVIHEKCQTIKHYRIENALSPEMEYSSPEPIFGTRDSTRTWTRQFSRTMTWTRTRKFSLTMTSTPTRECSPPRWLGLVHWHSDLDSDLSKFSLESDVLYPCVCTCEASSGPRYSSLKMSRDTPRIVLYAFTHSASTLEKSSTKCLLCGKNIEEKAP